MQGIKPVLIVCFVIVLVLVFRQRGRVGLRAGTRFVALGLVAAAIVFVVDPNIPQALAELVGVTRGTDLILYTLVVVFAMTSLSFYFGQRAAQVQIQQLARRVALSDAVASGGAPGTGRPPAIRPDATVTGDHGIASSASHPPGEQDSVE